MFLTPHVYLPVESRSAIRPDDRVAWFASYTVFISYYAAMAQRLGVEQFAVDSELASISDDRPGWLQIIREVRARYNGTVLYAAEPDEAKRVPFWDALDLIGIDAYIPLSTAPTTDVAALQQAWEPILAQMAEGSARYGRKILFTEAGYTSHEGTTTQPNNWRLRIHPARPNRRRPIKRCLRPSATSRGGRACTGGSGTPCRTTEAITLPTTPLGARPPNG